VVCGNCGHVAELYCPHCGQKQHGEQPSVTGFVRELLQETFSLEGRVLTTLRSVLTRPGELTLDFLEERRARHVSPLKLFLIVFAIFFFVSEDVIDVSRQANTLYGRLVEAHAAARGQTPADYLTSLHPQVLAGTKAMRAGLLVSSSLLYWLLFRRRRPRFVDHVVLALQTGTFSLSVGIVVNAIAAWTGSLALNFLVGMPLSAGYAALAARRVYGQGWGSTIWKVALIYLVSIVAGSMSLLAILGLVIAFN